jgi:hypothetical protein
LLPVVPIPAPPLEVVEVPGPVRFVAVLLLDVVVGFVVVVGLVVVVLTVVVLVDVEAEVLGDEELELELAQSREASWSTAVAP